MTKRIVVTALILMFSVGFVWAGGDSPTSDSNGDEEVVIGFWKFGSPQFENDYILLKMAEFEAANPGITVEWSYQQYGTKREIVLAAHSADQLPDIIALDGQSIPEFAELGIILPLEEVAPDRVDEWRSNYPEEIWNTQVYEGKSYAISGYVDATTFLGYNTKMFREAGIVDSNGKPRPPADWDELLEIAEMFTGDGVYGMALPASGHNLDVNMLEGIAYRNGGRWLVDGDVKINGPGFVDALSLYKDLVPFSPPGYMETNFRTAVELFVQNRTAMVITESFANILTQQFENAPDFEYTIAPFPLRSTKSGEFDKASFLMTPTTAMMVTRQVEDIDSIITFLDYWNTYDAQEGWSGSVIKGRIPTHIRSLESESFAEVYPALAAEYAAGTLFEGALPQEGFPGLTEATQILSIAMQEYLLSDIGAQEILDRAAEEAQAVIDSIE